MKNKLAFPNQVPTQDGEIIHRGMELRDYFAIRIFSTLDACDYPNEEIMIKKSYILADIMMEVRNSEEK